MQQLLQWKRVVALLLWSRKVYTRTSHGRVRVFVCILTIFLPLCLPRNTHSSYSGLGKRWGIVPRSASPPCLRRDALAHGPRHQCAAARGSATRATQPRICSVPHPPRIARRSTAAALGNASVMKFVQPKSNVATTIMHWHATFTATSTT